MSIEELYQLFLNSRGVSTDSRSIKPDQIFFALRGEIFDGNEYVAQAIEAGAAFAVVDNEEYYDRNNTKYILVEDSLKTLQNLATRHRKELKIPVIGLTGSNGKTTTKELIREVLKKKYFVSATAGNLNNHIGVPLTLLSIPYDTEIALVEMGANRVGDIKELCEIALPNYGMITNIGSAHLEGFGSIEGIIRGKTELYKHLVAEKGNVFVNGADEILMEKSAAIEDRIIYNTPDGVVSGEILVNDDHLNVEIVINDSNYVVQTQLYGDYNFTNVMAAAAVGVHFDVPQDEIIKALETYEPNNNRSQVVEWNNNVIIMDAYNANPTSMSAILESFFKGNYSKTMVILGEMNELGKSSDSLHKEIYQKLQEYNFDDVVLVGESFKKIAGENGEEYFADVDDLKGWFEKQGFDGYHILVKGSRSNELEKLIQ